MVHSHTVHLPLGALLTWCTVCDSRRLHVLPYMAGNYIVDLFFKSPIADAPKAAEELKNTCGVVDHGFFIGMTTAVIIAG